MLPHSGPPAFQQQRAALVAAQARRAGASVPPLPLPYPDVSTAVPSRPWTLSDVAARMSPGSSDLPLPSHRSSDPTTKQWTLPSTPGVLWFIGPTPPAITATPPTGLPPEVIRAAPDQPSRLASKTRPPRYELPEPEATLQLAQRLPWHGLCRAHWLELLGDSAEAQYTIACILSRLKSTSVKNARTHWNAFAVRFCAPRGFSPLPATRETVLKYIGWQAKQGTVGAGSLPNYLSTINRAHEDCGLPGPALHDDAQTGALAGLARLQTKLVAEDDRLYLKADHFSALLDHGLALPDIAPRCRQWAQLSAADKSLVCRLRDCVSAVFNFADFGRSDSQHGMKATDIVMDQQRQIIFRLRQVKGRTGVRPDLTFQWDAAERPDLTRLVERWLQLRARLQFPATCAMWRLPWETGRWTTTAFQGILTRGLSVTGYSAPPGFKYTTHSVRSGAATEAAAIDASLIKIRHLGGWARMSDTVHDYIDPTARPTPAAARFFGYLRAT